jgi:hypothetical protein
LLVVLADLHNQVGKYLSDAMLGVENYRLDSKAGCFKMSSGFFIDYLVFGSYFFPIQVLFKVRTACDDNAVTSAKESAVYSDNNRACGQGTRLNLLIPVKVFLNGFLCSAILIRKLLKSLFTKNVLLKESFLPYIRFALPDKCGTTLFAYKTLCTITRFTVFNYLKRTTFFTLFLDMKKG